MLKWHFRLFTLIFLLFAGNFAKATAFRLDNKKPYEKNHSSISSISKKYKDYQLINCNNAPIQVTNLPRHRSVHFLQCIYSKLKESTNYNKYLTFTCGEYSSGLSHFRKLILFPFHVFW